jgi:hypothetical protein
MVAINGIALFFDGANFADGWAAHSNSHVGMWLALGMSNLAFIIIWSMRPSE